MPWSIRVSAYRSHSLTAYAFMTLRAREQSFRTDVCIQVVGRQKRLVGEKSDSRLDVVVLSEELTCLNSEIYLSTTADEGDVDIFLLNENVCAVDNNLPIRKLEILPKVLP